MLKSRIESPISSQPVAGTSLTAAYTPAVRSEFSGDTSSRSPRHSMHTPISITTQTSTSNKPVRLYAVYPTHFQENSNTTAIAQPIPLNEARHQHLQEWMSTSVHARNLQSSGNLPLSFPVNNEAPSVPPPTQQPLTQIPDSGYSRNPPFYGNPLPRFPSPYDAALPPQQSGYLRNQLFYGSPAQPFPSFIPIQPPLPQIPDSGYLRNPPFYGHPLPPFLSPYEATLPPQHSGYPRNQLFYDSLMQPFSSFTNTQLPLHPPSQGLGHTINPQLHEKRPHPVTLPSRLPQQYQEELPQRLPRQYPQEPSVSSPSVQTDSIKMRAIEELERECQRVKGEGRRGPLPTLTNNHLRQMLPTINSFLKHYDPSNLALYNVVKKYFTIRVKRSNHETHSKSQARSLRMRVQHLNAKILRSNLNETAGPNETPSVVPWHQTQRRLP